MASYTSTAITSGWKFKQVGAVGVPEWSDGFLPVSQFPTNIHLDLMKHGKLPDPYIGTNEYDVQWVGEQQWQYSVEFHHEDPGSMRDQCMKCILRFEGLDTFATVSLNGHIILSADNMHRTFRVDVTETIQHGVNMLDIVFDVALVRGRQLLEMSNHHPVALNETSETSRIFVRKAQYHYGWNWGPELITCGPWRPISLETYSTRLSDLSCRVSVDIPDKAACVKIAARGEGCIVGDTLRLTMLDSDNREVGESIVASMEGGHADLIVDIPDAKFWWPVGYGKQPLYNVTADLIRNGICIHSIKKRIGLREAGLVRRPLMDSPGTTFFVQVNGVPLYSNGSNWCPADHFVPRVTTDCYRIQLNLLAEGNQNTVRVWGGGVFEEDIFYDICDELGILVWQDFMFACAAYPADHSFIENISAEVEDNLRRLRHHPCIVVWNGNNEDYLFAEIFKTSYNIKDTDPQNWLKSTFPARYIYEVVLPDLCQKFIPDASYHPGSPWGGESFNDPTVGDTHRWEVWHQLQPWQSYPKLKSRFISEFGMASLPHIKTIDSYLTEAGAFERHPHSRIVDQHNKEHQHERKLATYLVENFRYTYELDDYIYVSQLNQSEAMTCALRSWRREWKGTGKEYCGGALIWQFNSTWQVTSKALIDYFNRPKMAYYTVKRDMARITIGMDRVQIKTPRFKHTRAFVDEESRIYGWATNTTLSAIKLILHFRVFELSSGTEVLATEKLCDLPPNSSFELFDTTLPTLAMHKKDVPLIVSAQLLDAANGMEVIARCTNWPQPYRYLDIPTPSLQIRVDNGRISVKTTDVPVKGLWLWANDSDSLKFSDNCIDLVPNDEQVILVEGLGSHKLYARYYGMKSGAEVCIL